MSHSSGAEHHAVAVVPVVGFEERYHFWIRRLHSLSGVVPLGVFLAMHLITNASILGGEQIFDSNVARIHGLGPLLIPVELAFIFLPLAFHIGYGIRISMQARMNHKVYAYGANRRYSFQRISAWIATVFILYHIFHMHWLGSFGKALGGASFDPEQASATAAAAIQRHWFLPIWYGVGVVTTVYHFANGLWTALITWGVTLGARAQRRAGYICAVIGMVIGLAGLGAVFGFMTFKDPIPPLEQQQGVGSER